MDERSHVVRDALGKVDSLIGAGGVEVISVERLARSIRNYAENHMLSDERADALEQVMRDHAVRRLGRPLPRVSRS